MFRRIHDQSGAGETFFLYRVTLRTDIVLQDGCGPEVVDFMGDVALSDVCAPEIDAVRYVNAHEDPGSISLALGRSAIEAVQGIRVPIPTDIVPAWHSSAVERLLTASTEPVEIIEPDNALTRLQRRRRGPTRHPWAWFTTVRVAHCDASDDQLFAYCPGRVAEPVACTFQ